MTMDYKDLTVFKKGFDLAMTIFEESKKFQLKKDIALPIKSEGRLDLGV
jgi:hypothetical protein